MNTLREVIKDDALVWAPEVGVGYHPRYTPQIYDAAYEEKYQGYEITPMAAKLTLARIDLVNSFHLDGVVDVGVGSGQFVRERIREGMPTYGFDINPVAVARLKQSGLFQDPNATTTPAATFWDSLEHIPDPRRLLSMISKFVFVSAPIYFDLAHVLRSKHYRPGEHVWYWTDDGFKTFMKLFGFECVHRCSIESELGREDIGTYVFRRVS